ncbi:MAG: FkbM family methyltransferase [Alphaproteobacteria bacterium]
MSDLFIDVGAHWGLFALTVASKFRGHRPVIAIEVDPFNVTRLIKSVQVSGLTAGIEIVPCAMGARNGTAPLIRGMGTMGNSVEGAAFAALPGTKVPEPTCSVPVMTIDALLAERPQLDGKRVYLKVDVEGHELEVVAGASDLIASGRLAAMMLEKGKSYSQEPGLSKFRNALTELKDQGFSLYRFADRIKPGPLIAYEFSEEDCDVLCLAAGIQPLPWYG